MWLINRLTPAFKTIADSARTTRKAIVGYTAPLSGSAGAVAVRGRALAIDGTKIAAVASRKQVMTPKRIEKMNAAIDRKIATIWLRWTKLIGRAGIGRKARRYRGCDRSPQGTKGALQTRRRIWRRAG